MAWPQPQVYTTLACISTSSSDIPFVSGLERFHCRFCWVRDSVASLSSFVLCMILKGVVSRGFSRVGLIAGADEGEGAVLQSKMLCIIRTHNYYSYVRYGMHDAGI